MRVGSSTCLNESVFYQKRNQELEILLIGFFGTGLEVLLNSSWFFNHAQEAR
jgi:hypothetical protein